MRRFCKFSAVVLGLAAFVGGTSTVRAQFDGLPNYGRSVNFESSLTRPLCLSPDGRRLFVLNSPDARLSIFDVSDPADAIPRLVREIPVGLEPVAVNALSSNDVWVVNGLNGSVSVVSVNLGAIVANLPCPVDAGDVVFAAGKAFVSCAGSNLLRVFDLRTRQALGTIPIQGLQPRALTVSGDGRQVYAAIAMSGNRTTLLPASLAPAQGEPTNPNLPPPPQVGLIVSADDARLEPKPILPDNDLAQIDAASATVTRYFQGVGTINFALAVRPGTQEVWVANTEARNLIRFEPALRGHVVDNRITRVATDSGQVTPFDLNPGLDYSLLPNPAALATSLAQPTGLVFEPDGMHFWVASFGTDRIARVHAATGLVGRRIETGPTTDGSADPPAKRGPRNLVYQASTGRIYVFNRISNTLSVVASASGQIVAEVPAGSYDPTPQVVRAGRGFLYDARLSGNGTASCASCHVDGHRDGLAWDLGDPGGELDTSTIITQHPMKGPMMTQTFRAIIGTPLHWRGDRRGIGEFNATFSALLGGSVLSTAQMEAFQAFLATIAMPPNTNLPLNRRVPTSLPPGDPEGGNPLAGAQAFSDDVFGDSTTFGPLHCTTCHNFQNGWGINKVPASVVQQSQGFGKVPQLREFSTKQFLRPPPEVSLSGFGLTHDGGESSIFSFFQRPFFGTVRANPQKQRDLRAFLLFMDTGMAPAVGAARHIHAANLAEMQADWNALEGNIGFQFADLIARARIEGENVGLQYVGNYITDRAGLGPFTRSELETMIAGGNTTLTIMGVPVRSGVRMAIEHNGVNAPPTSFAEWQRARFSAAELLDPNISGPAADPDGDGEDNLAEYRSITLPRDAASTTRSGQAINVSTRLRTQTGENVLIGGFVIAGAEPKQVIVRALGPSLANAGVTGALSDPTLDVFDAGGRVLANNNDWRDTQAAEVSASGLAPSHDRESALVLTLLPGAYTAVVRGAGAGTGVALVEVYDLTPGVGTQLINVSTRGRVETGDNVMIGGFVVGRGLGVGEAGTARVLIRAVGPSLAQAGLFDVLVDPVLELHDASGAILAINDDWRESQRAAIELTGLAPASAAESAILVTLPRGSYTAVVRGRDGGVGVALVEVYKLP